MDEEAGFLAAIAAAPNDLVTHLVYADWLDERDDPGGSCLRVWTELVGLTYEEPKYRNLVSLLEQFRASLQAAEPEWVALVGETRDWVGPRLAELSARLHLRVQEGRKANRQWIGQVKRSVFHPVWHVYYWPNDPARRRGPLFCERQKCLEVDRVTGEIKPPAEPGAAPDPAT